MLSDAGVLVAEEAAPFDGIMTSEGHHGGDSQDLLRVRIVAPYNLPPNYKLLVRTLMARPLKCWLHLREIIVDRSFKQHNSQRRQFNAISVTAFAIVLTVASGLLVAAQVWPSPR